MYFNHRVLMLHRIHVHCIGTNIKDRSLSCLCISKRDLRWLPRVVTGRIQVFEFRNFWFGWYFSAEGQLGPLKT